MALPKAEEGIALIRSVTPYEVTADVPVEGQALHSDQHMIQTTFWAYLVRCFESFLSCRHNLGWLEGNLPLQGWGNTLCFFRLIKLSVCNNGNTILASETRWQPLVCF